MLQKYYKEDVRIFNIPQDIPVNAEELGALKISDNGFPMHCKYDDVIALAKAEVKKAGGSALKITEHRKPDSYSSCHRAVGIEA